MSLASALPALAGGSVRSMTRWKTAEVVSIVQLNLICGGDTFEWPSREAGGARLDLSLSTAGLYLWTATAAAGCRCPSFGLELTCGRPDAYVRWLEDAQHFLAGRTCRPGRRR